MPRPRIKKLLLSCALDRYHATVSRFKKGEQQEFYRIGVLKRHPLASRMMDDITAVDIARYRDDRLAQCNPKTGKPLSTSTVRLELALLSSLFTIASQEWGTCRDNPVARVRKPKPAPGRDRRLSRQEERRITAHFAQKNPELNIIVQLAIETAMRQGELLSLTWQHIHWRAGTALLPETKNGTARSVPLSHKAISLLKQQQTATQHATEDGRVFTYRAAGLKSAWRLAIKALNITGLTFHDLRHEAISRLVELGTLSDVEVSAISGHKSMAMLKRYTHLRMGHLTRKLNARRRKKPDPARCFVPWPATVQQDEHGVTVTFPDFEALSVTANSLDVALPLASTALLRELATRLAQGIAVPETGHAFDDAALQTAHRVSPL